MMGSQGLTSEKFGMLAGNLVDEASKLRVTFGDAAVDELRIYSERDGVASQSEYEIAIAIAVLGYCAIGKAIYESLQRWGTARVSRVDIIQTITYAHIPIDVDDPCPKAVGAVMKSKDAFETILPPATKEILDSLG